MLRKAAIGDIPQMQELINAFARADLMLPRSRNELYENLRDFWVFEDGRRVVGCAALHICWDDLVEVKAVAVAKKYQGKGIGRKLVEACIGEAREMGARRVFVLTYKPEYFKQFGFRKTTHSSLPHKIWAECINCPKFPNCEETALIRKV
ncbi:MAG TPA: N-acetyltransferase [Patescibacteria group bacterium]|nr:N-acetyltransferase [Patescibacteria group bacterium]